ncbi:MAG: GAF domain-containing protein [Planctomycetota bacterium]
MDAADSIFVSPTLRMPGVVAPAPLSAVSAPETASRLLHAQRLAAVLRGAVEGLGLAGGELHLLDDATAELRVAADFGEGPTPEPRALESAEADLAAMAGGAVVLEDADMVAEWGAPGRCRAAVCVPVASDTTIHGTLWLYNAKPRAFSDSEVQLAEVVAGRLAVEIERRRLLDASTAVAFPQSALTLPEPARATEFAELEVAGVSSADSPGAFHDWSALEDGRLLVVAGAIVDAPGASRDEAVLAAQAARVALRCYAEGARDAGQLLTRASRCVWQTTAGGEGVSLAVALIDPEQYAGSYALAGGAATLSIRASLTLPEVTDAQPAGWDEDARYEAAAFELSPRERFALTAIDPRHSSADGVDKLAGGFRGLASETHRLMTAEGAAQTLAASTPAPQAAVVVRWK